MTESLRWLTLAFVFAVATPAQVAPQEDSWLSYFPSVVRLRGKVTTVTKYGKPTYGENPEKDEKLEVPILILQTPIRVKANPISSANNESITNISFVQLIFPPEVDADFKKYVDHSILVAGTLSVGSRSGQFTDVVLTVKAINPTGKPF
jgi:hypothetical protein